MTFDEFKQRTAADIRKVAELLEERAVAAEQGNMDAVDEFLMTEWRDWHELLLIRFAHCRNVVERP